MHLLKRIEASVEAYMVVVAQSQSRQPLLVLRLAPGGDQRLHLTRAPRQTAHSRVHRILKLHGSAHTRADCIIDALEHVKVLLRPLAPEALRQDIGRQVVVQLVTLLLQVL